ncbi:gamm1 protein [Chrysochromulina tobinii]|uniref:Gamm1 protein n=1 Tax=Chrysochromulina tobinii TaxID=1460289 RepID=A0A0M0JV92_9EUKA|nr:gamm1 protein [Chrysochromulina tobinii]|eukprot:KOO30043.1 gamm1 protein [Chrysochromulina sp. CCMP291]
MATIGTHSGAFQADEALGVWLLRQLPQYESAPLIRSRDMEKLKPLTIVIDVAGTYDHDLLRYDHHQRGFFETFDGENKAAKDGGRPDVTGPETATGEFKTKLSASGLVYKHYGREVLIRLHPSLSANPDALDWVYRKMYEDFMEAIDGNDNGIELAEAVRYKESSTLPHRVHRLNARWNAPKDGPTEDERFETASALCGAEFGEMLRYIVECELPAREIVETALRARTAVHASGRARSKRYELERRHGLPAEGLVQFVLYPDSSGMWRVQAVTVEGTAFTNRLGLLEPWRGLRDAELVARSGIDGCKFVHATGFIGGNATYDGALAMALKTIEGGSTSVELK